MAKNTKDKMDEVREKSQKRRLQKAQEFADELVDKLGDKVVSVVVWGSVSRGEHTSKSDIDTFVLLDDTKLQQDVPREVQEKIRYKVLELAQKVDKRITLQYFTFLTDFWDQLRHGEPLAIDVLRLGIPVYDAGVFAPAKRLLERGRIYGTREAVYKRMGGARMTFQKMQRDLRHSMPFHLEQAVTNAGQSPVMLLGRMPPGKAEVTQVLEELFVKPGMLEQECVDKAKAIQELQDKAEKGEITVTGDMLEEHMQKAEEFLKRIDQLLQQLSEQQKIRDLLQDYKMFLRANVAALKSKEVQPPEKKEDLPQVVQEHLDLTEEQQELFTRWDDVLTKVREKREQEIDNQEIYNLRTDTRKYINEVGQMVGTGRAIAQEQVDQELPDDIDDSSSDTEQEEPETASDEEHETAAQQRADAKRQEKQKKKGSAPEVADLEGDTTEAEDDA